MEYNLSPDRVQLLKDSFIEFSFEDKLPNKDFFDSIQKPEELHFIADFYNWDDGPEVLTWIIDSDLCDEGTAKMIFWKSEPQDYTPYEKAEEVEYDDGVFTLFEKNIGKLPKRFLQKS